MRFSLATISVIVAVFVFAFLAGGVVINRFEHASQTSATQQQAQENDDRQDEANDKESPDPHAGQPKPHKATGARTSEPDDVNDKD